MKHFKKTAGLVVLFLMLAPIFAFAQFEQNKQKGSDEFVEGAEQGLEAQNNVEFQNQGEGQENQIELREQVQAGQKANNENVQGNQNGQEKNQANDKAIQRRSRVANAVQEMLQVAERNQGVGQQIRTIAQTQNQNQEQIEAEMNQVKNRGQLRKFFFGPDYKSLNSIEDKLADSTEKINQLKELAKQITEQADIEILENQIEVMEQIKKELKEEVGLESSGFSLFGWLNKIFSRYSKQV